MARKRMLTELEGTVLGVVWSHQPCTPYLVRRTFSDSPSPYWSGSAGAIYPIMARLEAGGLVRSIAQAAGARKSRAYSLTPAGRRELVRWVGPPVPEEVIGVPPDPLRMRVACLGVLSPAKQRELLNAMTAGVQAHLERSQRALAAGAHANDESEPMARGAIAMQESRLAWLGWVRKRVAGRRVGGSAAE